MYGMGFYVDFILFLSFVYFKHMGLTGTRSSTVPLHREWKIAQEMTANYSYDPFAGLVVPPVRVVASLNTSVDRIWSLSLFRCPTSVMFP